MQSVSRVPKQHLLRWKQLERKALDMDLDREVVLDETIRPARADLTMPHRRVLLTGASGFLGVYLLRELLEQTDAEVVCLIRCTSPENGLERIRSAMGSYKVWKDRYQPRIHPLPGDLSKPLWGLTRDDFTALGNDVDAIYHNGAFVNLLYPYHMLKAISVGGTQEAIRFAAQRGIQLHFISTVGIFQTSDCHGQTVYEDDDPAFAHVGLRIGYDQAKWVAERLVRTARSRGLPVTIYRPGIIGWDQHTGVANPNDFIHGVLDGCIAMGAAPRLPIRAEMASVDYVAKSIIHASGLPKSANMCFHTAPHQLLMWDELIEICQSLGYRLEHLPYDEWRDRLEDFPDSVLRNQFACLLPVSEAEQLSSLVDVLHEKKEPIWDIRNLVEAIAGSNIQCPLIDARYVDVHLKTLG